MLHKGLKLDNVSWVMKSFYSRILRDKMEIIYFFETEGIETSRIYIFFLP